MFTHVMIGSNDLARSEQFYNAVLGVLGAAPAIHNKSQSGHNRIFYQHDGNRFGISEPINNEPATPANGATLGFKCTSAEQARLFHDTAVAHGGTSIENPPGLRQSPSLGPVYLAYVRDPDGNKLCALFKD